MGGRPQSATLRGAFPLGRSARCPLCRGGSGRRQALEQQVFVPFYSIGEPTVECGDERQQPRRSFHSHYDTQFIQVMIIHLIDGTYELFRHFYGFRRTNLPGSAAGSRRRSARDDHADAGRRARRTWRLPPITSSSRSATTSGPATRPARGSIRRCGRSSIPSKSRSWPWA